MANTAGYLVLSGMTVVSTVALVILVMTVDMMVATVTYTRGFSDKMVRVKVMVANTAGYLAILGKMAGNTPAAYMVPMEWRCSLVMTEY
jgi:hypothetical protein